MPDVTVNRLTFRSGLHVGTRGVNLEEADVCIPSDTIFAALVDALRRAGGDPTGFVAPFPRLELAQDTSGDAEPPFLLTSAFPFASSSS